MVSYTYVNYIQAFTQCRIASAGLRSGTLSTLKSLDDTDSKSNSSEKSWNFPISFSLPAPIRAGILLGTGGATNSALTVSVGSQDEIWGRPSSLQVIYCLLLNFNFTLVH